MEFEAIPRIVAASAGWLGNELTFRFPQVLDIVKTRTANVRANNALAEEFVNVIVGRISGYSEI
jgi:hypothetical protein